MAAQEEKEIGIIPIKRKQMLLVSLTTVTVCAAIAVAVVITLYIFENKRHFHGYETKEAAELYENAAVSADAVTCSEIGKNILKRNGSVVDAAVASCFCLGVINMHSSGLGGGGMMLVYTRKNKTIEAFDYREKAPAKVREDLYADDFNKSRVGGLAIAVPGEVKGLYAAWKKYGKLPWQELVQPAINLTRDGFHIQLRLHEATEELRLVIENDPGLRKLLFKKDGRPLELGTQLKIPELAATLKKIQKDPESFYTGSLAKDVVKDIQDAGGLVTLEDLADYKVENRKVLVDNTSFSDMLMYTFSAPTGGPIVTQILNILKGYNLTSDDIDGSLEKSVLTYHRIAEAFKFGYAQRTKEGDPQFVDKKEMDEIMKDMTSREVGEKFRKKITDNTTQNVSFYGPKLSQKYDKGTTHVSLYAPNGDAVAVTSTVNEWFGAAYRSDKTGIIYNNEMDDFGIPGSANIYGFPPTPANLVRPGKRPLSSSVPAIVVHKNGDVKMVLGSSGGTRIITAVTFVLMYKLWFGNELGRAISRPRFHHQLIPNWVIVERTKDRELPKTIQKGLEKRGHQVWYTSRPEYSSVQAIYVEKPGKVYAKSDPRKYGFTAGF